MCLFFCLFSKDEIERLKQRDILEEVIREMAGEFPSMSLVFIDERDMYLAKQLHRIADRLSKEDSGGSMITSMFKDRFVFLLL